MTVNIHVRDDPGEREAALAVNMLLVVWRFATLPLWGFVLLKLWQWFVEPLGAPPLPLGIACGLIVLISFMRYRVRTKPLTINEAASHVWAAVFAPALFLLLGYLVHVIAS